MSRIFPSSITEFSTEGLIKKHSTKSKVIYWLVIFSVVAFGIAVFFVNVDVNVHSRGIITSLTRATKINAPVFGNIQVIYLKENDFVSAGDTLLFIDTTDIQKSIRINNEKILLVEEQIQDLEYLTSLTKKRRINFAKTQTLNYKQELQKFKSDLRFQRSEMVFLGKEYIRQKKLYEKNVISLSEYEKVKFKYENAKLKYDKIFDNQLTTWQADLLQNKIQLFSLNDNVINLHKEIEKYFLKAPISGYILNLSGIKQDGMIYPNQEICTISPINDLIVETYISPADIGLVEKGQKVKFSVDALNFNQWGMLEGKILEIAKDINVDKNGIIGFKVRCVLETTYLTYHGKTVNVKKGMTLTTNFLLARRTLAQLLYDKVTDWMNPNVVEIKH